MNANNKFDIEIPRKEKEDNKIMGMQEFIYVGIGAAGNKAAVELVKENVVSKDQVVLINSTDRDFPAGFGGKTLVLTSDNAGCGKEREVSKRYAAAAISAGSIDSIIGDAEGVCIVTSLEGGTGSGSAPIIGRYCAQSLGKTVRIFGFAGFEDDARGMQNTVEFFQELDFECITHVIRNSLFNAGSRFASEQAANEEFAKQIRILSAIDIIASSQNMDSTDVDKTRNTQGYCVVNRIDFDDSLMEVDDFNKLCKRAILQCKSLKSEYGQLRFGVILNVKPESEDAIDYDFKLLKSEYGTPYDSFMHKQYDGGKQYIAYIAAGMKLPLEEVKAVYERYKQASASVDKSADNFFSEIENMKRTDEDSRFDVGLNRKKPTISREEFLKQYDGGNAREKK